MAERNGLSELNVEVDIGNLAAGGENGAAGAGNQRLGTVRDRLFHAMVVKVAVSYSSHVSPRCRVLIEFAILTLAICMLFTLVYVHFTHSRYHGTCLQSIKDTWPRKGILRVEVIKNLPEFEASLTEGTDLNGTTHFNPKDILVHGPKFTPKDWRPRYTLSDLQFFFSEDSYEDGGYLKDLLHMEHYHFVTTNVSHYSYITAMLIMLIFIFLFIIDLLQMFELNEPLVFPVAPLLTVILALVGMEAIMSEIFNDTSTAFYVILLVWMADQYDAICCRSSTSRKHWLRFFYLYHFAFYAYQYKFGGQYNVLALLTSAMFILHVMVFFFHHYEIPLILHQEQLVRVVGAAQHEVNQVGSGELILVNRGRSGSTDERADLDLPEAVLARPEPPASASAGTPQTRLEVEVSETRTEQAFRPQARPLPTLQRRIRFVAPAATPDPQPDLLHDLSATSG